MFLEKALSHLCVAENTSLTVVLYNLNSLKYCWNAKAEKIKKRKNSLGGFLCGGCFKLIVRWLLDSTSLAM
jgi:hypothetical protein